MSNGSPTISREENHISKRSQTRHVRADLLRNVNPCPRSSYDERSPRSRLAPASKRSQIRLGSFPITAAA